MSKSKLIQRLEKLTPEEQALVSKLLGVVDEADEVQETVPTEPKKNSKRKQRRKSEQSNEEEQVPRRKIVVDDENLDDALDEPTLTKNAPSGPRRVKSRTEARQERRKVRRPGSAPADGRKPRKYARSESVDTSGNRPNKFLKSEYYNAERGDVAVDKLLSKGKKPSARREAPDMIEVECNRCHDIWEVPPSYVYRDDEGIAFICQDCTRRGKD